MKNAICLTGHVLVSDILTALEPMVDEGLLSKLDVDLASRRDDRIDFDDTEVLVEAAIDALDEADKLPVPESLLYQVDETDIIGLAEAIRCGERERAETLLDIIFSTIGEASTVRELIDRGRYSKKARDQRQAQPKLRSVA